MGGRRNLGLAAVGLTATLLLAGCGGDDGGDSAAEETTDTTTAETTTTVAAESMRILVSNDDGYGAEGIDALVEGLLTLEDVEITVSAPAENQSGSSDTTEPGEQTETEVETISGYPATSVDGYPADSVEQGLAAMADAPPHLVISGINEGQNIGPLTELSGTVGAARTGARAGVTALATSQGLFTDGGPEPAYETAVPLILEWVEANREAILAGETVEVWNLNVPTCDGGELGELIETEVATEAQASGLDLGAVDCNADVDPATIDNDVAGFLAGHPVLTPLTY